MAAPRELGTEQIREVLAALQPPAFFVAHDNRIAVANEAARALLGGTLVGLHYVSALRQPPILDAIDSVLRGGPGGRANIIASRDIASRDIASRDIASRDIASRDIASHGARDIAPHGARDIASRGARDAVWVASVAPLGAAPRRGALVSLEDITATQEAGQMRRDFVANVSHELRTPLTALIGFIETLGGAARDDAAARDRFLAIMAREANRMNRLVQDLLSLSRVESEERLRPTGRVEPGDLLRSVALSLAPMLERRGVAIALEGCEGLGEISGDPDQLRQVFSNLIENAAKYGGGATVHVVARRLDHDPAMRAPALRIDVVDEGDGIDAIHLPRLTERFYRIDNHRSREIGGTGLGLAIVKHIVNRHRGRLRIASAPGRGSTFSVLLPLP